MLPPVAVAEVRDLEIPTSDGRVIKARLYRADAALTPLLVFYHGGGWEIGSIEVADRPLRRLANDSGFAVLSVDYRLAPEDPFPAAFDDCYEATVWASTHRESLGGNDEFFSVGGDSAGGNLAAAVTQRIRDLNGPRIDHQLLIYPVVQRRFDSASYREFATGYFLTRRTMQSFWNMYVGPSASPIYADLFANGSLHSLPAATIFTASLDPLRDEGELYAQELSRANVPVTLIRVDGVIHGIWYMDATGKRAYQIGLDIAHSLRLASSTTLTD